MKYCTKCGNIMADDDAFCAKCGAKADDNVESKTYDSYGNETQVRTNSIDKKDLITLIKIFTIICVVGSGCAIFPLFWTIPMTISLFRKLDNGEKISVEFKICFTIFVSIIAGIFLFVDDSL